MTGSHLSGSWHLVRRRGRLIGSQAGGLLRGGARLRIATAGPQTRLTASLATLCWRFGRSGETEDVTLVARTDGGEAPV